MKFWFVAEGIVDGRDGDLQMRKDGSGGKGKVGQALQVTE